MYKWKELPNTVIHDYGLDHKIYILKKNNVCYEAFNHPISIKLNIMQEKELQVMHKSYGALQRNAQNNAC